VARPRKRFSQHFLTNASLLRRIVDALDPAPGDRVLEIGPGGGTLTGELLERGAVLSAIEIDRDLVPGLRARFPGARIVEGDALTLDWHTLLGPGPFLVTGNIPYHITSPLLDKALTPPAPTRIVFLVQKEVADRVTAEPGTGAYGGLTIGVQVVARAERLFVVPAGAFQPRPRVDSAVIRLTPREHPSVPGERLALFRRFVTGVFGFRRKQLLRGLRGLTRWTPGPVRDALAAAGIEPTARPEVLGPGEFARLFATLVDAGWGRGVGL
jgi:16S rRNA (adenine1518-N6/adenine1519-N6)-dimethyltransferase